MPLKLTDESFEEFIDNTQQPILVEFWADWCIPCKKLTPIIKDIAYHYKGKLVVKKCNINDVPNTLKKYNIKAFPALVIFKESKPIASKIGGIIDKNRVTAFIDSHI